MVTIKLSAYLARVLLGNSAQANNAANLAKVGISLNNNANWSTFGANAKVNGVSGVLSKMVQDVIGMTVANQRSKAYIVSRNSGFSDGSGVSMYAKLRQGKISIMNNGFNIKDETSGVTTLKGAMAVMDIAETAIVSSQKRECGDKKSIWQIFSRNTWCSFSKFKRCTGYE